MNFWDRCLSWLRGTPRRQSSLTARQARAKLGETKRQLRSERLEGRDLMAALVWDGNNGNGRNTVWSAWSNWNPNVVPQNGDTLTFAGNRKLTNWNDLNLSIQNIIIRSNGFNIDGNAINLGSGGIHFVGGSVSHWGIPLGIAHAETPLEVYGARTFYLHDVIYGSGGLGKYGVGTAVLNATSTYSGTTTIYDGTLYLNGALANSDVVIAGGVLTGAGRAQSVDLEGGAFSPGAGLGTFTVTHGATLDRGRFQIELQGNSADQLLVTGGDVTLGGALEFFAAGNFQAPAHRVYALVNNTGPGTLTGAFANFADGQTVLLNGQRFEVRYGYDAQGDGHLNDVVLVKANSVPVAADDAFNVTAGGQLVLAAPGLLANDSDADADALALALVQAPAHGTVELAPDGSLVYTPDDDFVGDDALIYAIDDGHGGVAQATVHLAVVRGAVPEIGANNFSTVTGAAVTAQLRATDADSPTLTYRLVSGPRYGSVIVQPDGRFTYSPGAYRSGTVSFTFAVSDGAATVEGVATVAVRYWNGRGIRPDVLDWILAHNPGLSSNFLKTAKPDRVIHLPDGRSTQLYKLDQFLDVNFKLDFKSRQKEHVNKVQRWEWQLRRLLALPETYYWFKNHSSTYRIAGLGQVSSERAYQYIRNISKTIWVTASSKVKAPVGGGNGINAPSWAVWEQMNIFWHEACHVIGIGHNSGGISGPLAGKLRDWDQQRRWDYNTIDVNTIQVPQ